MEIIPNTYTFPGDYNIWVDEFRRLEKSVWIMKPASGCQGKGIFLVNKMD